ncbi:CoA transferase [Fulvivirga sp. M361]|nr:CoA transferase [Fulvivirga sp. M361]
MISHDLFKGCRVIELASVLAGPSVGQFFAELGAEVIKVENPGTHGDVTRSWRGKGEKENTLSAYFCCTNWGKKSLALDISKVPGQEILYKLIASSDFVITSYKSGDAVRLGVDYETLSRHKKDLVYGEITGYGQRDLKVGYDAVIQAEAGFMSMNGHEDGPPTKMPVALIDLLAAHQLKEAMLLAYIQKLQTGDGAYVSVSLLDAALASLANQGTNWLMAKSNPQRKGSTHPNIAPYGDIYHTRDSRQIILAVGTNRQFKQLCQVLDMKHIPEDIDFNTNENRVKNRQKLLVLLAAKIRMWTGDLLIEKLNAANVPVGSVNTVAEALALPYASALLLKKNDFSGVRSFTEKGILEKSSHILPPPQFGEHTQEILRDILSLDTSEINILINKGTF